MSSQLLLQPEHFDLAQRLTFDFEFRERVQSLVSRVADLERFRASKPATYLAETNKVIASIWRDSGRNSALLMPYFYPRYPKKAPLDMLQRPFNMVLLYMLVYHSSTLRGSRQIGKTTTLGTRQRLNVHLFDDFSSIYVAPHMGPLETYGRKFLDMESAFRYPVVGSKLKQNLYFKKYANRSQIEMIRVQSSATPARGKSADELIVDECCSSTTYVNCQNKFIKIVDVTKGDVILAFDEQHRITTDTVKAVVCKGPRHTWRVVTGDGTTLECTSNERLRSTRGWVYLADLLDFSEVSRCPRGKTYRERGRHAVGDSAGGCLPGVDHGLPLSALPREPRPSSEGLLLGEVSVAVGVLQPGPEGHSERRLRHNDGQIRDPHDGEVFLARKLVSAPPPDQSASPKESSDPGMGGPAHLGSSSLVVHGRRLQAIDGSDDFYPLLFESGGGPVGGLADESRLPRSCRENTQGRDQGILDPPDPDRVGGDLQEAGESLHPTDDALQAGGGRPRWAGVQLFVLRRALSKPAADQSGDPMLSETGVQEGPQPPAWCEVGNEAGQRGGVSPRAGGANQRPGKEGGSPRQGVTASAGGLRGSSLPDQDERLEKGISAQAESGGQTGPGSPPEPYLPVLRGDVCQLEGAHSEAKLAGHLLPRPGVLREEGKGDAPDSAGPAECETGGWVMVPSEIVSIEYAGEQEVWDIETEKHHTFFAGGIAVHNCQLFDPGLLTELLEVLSDSAIQSVLYAGTSTTVETLLETEYQAGTQGVWQVLKDDGSVLDCGDHEQVCDHIGPYFLVDPVTKNRLDPLRGYYKYLNPAGFADMRLSVHVPQIINPDIANDKLAWNRLYRTMIRDKKRFIQEKLGIPLEEANREVTKADLKRICVITDGRDELKKKCREGYYRCIISGFDWGGSDYNPMTRTKISNTFHVITGVAPNDKVHILHAKAHGGASYRNIMDNLLMDHFAFSAGAMASDFGGGQQYHSLLRSHPLIDASRHIIFDYDNPDSALCKPMSKEIMLENAFMLNRTESITALYMAILMNDPILLAPVWEESEDYMTHFLNLTRVMTEKGEGRRFRYNRHGSKSDDFVHALNMAYSLLRLAHDQTLIADPEGRTKLRGAVYSDTMGGVSGHMGDPWASALSHYARGTDEHD